MFHSHRHSPFAPLLIFKYCGWILKMEWMIVVRLEFSTEYFSMIIVLQTIIPMKWMLITFHFIISDHSYPFWRHTIIMKVWFASCKLSNRKTDQLYQKPENMKEPRKIGISSWDKWRLAIETTIDNAKIA